VAQAAQNASALPAGPLPSADMAEIARLLSAAADGHPTP
jgi:hypothetical protein